MADYNPQPIVFHTLTRYAVPFLPDAVPQRRGQTAAQISASANSYSKRMKTVWDRARPESGERARSAGSEEVIAPPEKEASIRRPLQLGKQMCSRLQFVMGWVPFDFRLTK